MGLRYGVFQGKAVIVAGQGQPTPMILQLWDEAAQINRCGSLPKALFCRSIDVDGL